MSDEEKTDEQVKSDPKPEDKPAEKLFTQAEVDGFIKDRLAREKQTAGRKSDNAESSLKAANGTIEAYEKVLQKQLDSQTTDLPDSIKKILGKLTITEQLDWLADPENSISKRQSTPKTPIAPRGAENFVPSKVDKII